MAQTVPTGMIFVPSFKGINHSAVATFFVHPRI